MQQLLVSVDRFLQFLAMKVLGKFFVILCATNFCGTEAQLGLKLESGEVSGEHSGVMFNIFIGTVQPKAERL